jgi:hypothetical protein
MYERSVGLLLLLGCLVLAVAALQSEEAASLSETVYTSDQYADRQQQDWREDAPNADVLELELSAALEIESANPSVKRGKGSGGRSGYAPASTRLTSQEHKSKYDRFLSLHPRRARQLAHVSAHDRSTSFATFTSNRARIVALNDKHAKAGQRTSNKNGNGKIFRSAGPFADMPAEVFKKKYLTARHPRHSKSKPSAPPRSSAKNWRTAGKSASVKTKKQKSSASRQGKVKAKKSSRRLTSGSQKPRGRALIESESDSSFLQIGRYAASAHVDTGDKKPAFKPKKRAGGTAGVAGGTGGKSGRTAGSSGGNAGEQKNLDKIDKIPERACSSARSVCIVDCVDRKKRQDRRCRWWIRRLAKLLSWKQTDESVNSEEVCCFWC